MEELGRPPALAPARLPCTACEDTVKRYEVETLFSLHLLFLPFARDCYFSRSQVVEGGRPSRNRK